MSDYPIQGKLRIRPANFERDAQYIRAHVGELSDPELKSVPGYEYLKFWYADFACTDAQWAALAPELDQRNILATLYEAPVFASEVVIRQEEPKGRKPLPPVTLMLNAVAAAVLLVATVLVLTSAIDGVACALTGSVALLLLIIGQVYGRKRQAPMAIEDAPRGVP